MVYSYTTDLHGWTCWYCDISKGHYTSKADAQKSYDAHNKGERHFESYQYYAQIQRRLSSVYINHSHKGNE